MINKKIGPYTLFKRTEYSKFQVLNNDTNITNTDIGDKIIADYIKQTKNPDKYFSISNNILEAYNGKDIDYIFMPDTIEYIDKSSFASCSAIFIQLPESLVCIGNEAFRNCEYLEEITLPLNVKNFGNSVFDGCTSLKKVELPEKIKEIPIYSFGGCDNLKEIYIPDSVETINSLAFSGCKNLEKINIPHNFKWFGSIPFSGSGLITLRFNYDLSDSCNPMNTYSDFLLESQIYKIEISNNVSHIDPNFFKYANGIMLESTISPFIMEVNYLGTNKEFTRFKKENKEFLKSIKSAKINILGNLDTLIDKNKPETKSSRKDLTIER